MPEVRAQAICPPTPQSYTHGGLTVLEGLVVDTVSGSGPLSRGWDAAVALDDPVDSPARFLVAWVTDTQQSSPAEYEEIMATGFAADGTCIYPPHALSQYHGCTPGLFCVTNPWLPSVSMSRDHSAGVGVLVQSLETVGGPLSDLLDAKSAIQVAHLMVMERGF